MKKAVVTGASGLLGAHVACCLLKHGWSVTCLKHQSGTQTFEKIGAALGVNTSGVTWKYADILDTDSLLAAFEGADAVFHCAGLVKYRKQDYDALFQVNVEGTKNVCNTCLKLKTPVLVHASSIAALAKKPGASVVDEDSEWVPSSVNSLYSVSKHLAEMEVWRAAEEGLNVGIVNPGVILGVGDGLTSSSSIFSHVKSGNRFYPIGRTGFVGAEDVAEAMVIIAEQGIFNKRILLVGENLFYKDMLQMVAKHLHAKAPTVPLKGLLLRFAISLATLAEAVGLRFPFPAKGLKSTSTDTSYVSKNIALLPGFKHTPIAEVIEKSAPLIFSNDA